MKIGDEVTIANVNKKCTVQTEIFSLSDFDGEIYVETIWREGKFRIILNSNWEIENLRDTIEGGYELETEDYEDCQLIGTYDSQSLKVSDDRFLSQEELYGAGYECIREYYIIYDGVKLVEELK